MKVLAHRIRRRFDAGYSLIEVLVAAGLLTIGVAAAAKLSLVMVTQEEINQRVSVSLAHQEIAVRLMQLGLDPTEVSALLPDEPDVASLTFATPGTTISSVGAFTYIDVTMVTNSTPAGAHASGEWNGGGDAAASETRTNVVRAYLYTNRNRSMMSSTP